MDLLGAFVAFVTLILCDISSYNSQSIAPSDFLITVGCND